MPWNLDCDPWVSCSFLQNNNDQAGKPTKWFCDNQHFYIIYIYIYIYIYYIYIYSWTDFSVVSQLFIVDGHAIRSKPGSKAD